MRIASFLLLLVIGLSAKAETSIATDVERVVALVKAEAAGVDCNWRDVCSGVFHVKISERLYHEIKITLRDRDLEVAVRAARPSEDDLSYFRCPTDVFQDVGSDGVAERYLEGCAFSRSIPEADWYKITLGRLLQALEASEIQEEE